MFDSLLTQHVEGANSIGLEGLDWVVHVLDGGGGGRQVVDLVDWRGSHCVTQHHTVSFCVTQCHTVSFCITPCHTVLFCHSVAPYQSHHVILCHSHTISFCITQCHTVSFCVTVSHRIIVTPYHSVSQCHTISFCVTQCHTVSFIATLTPYKPSTKRCSTTSWLRSSKLS